MSPRARLRKLRALRDQITREIDNLEVAVRVVDDADARGVIAEAARQHSITTDLLLSRNKETHVVRARQEAAWMLRQRGLSYPSIGRLLDRDHTTIMAAVRKVDAERLRPRLIRGGVA